MEGGCSMFSIPCPNLDLRVTTTTGKQLTIGAESDRVNILSMPRKGLEQLPALRLPQRNSVVSSATATCQETSVGAESDRLHIPRSCKGLEQLPALRVPQLDGIVHTTACQD